MMDGVRVSFPQDDLGAKRDLLIAGCVILERIIEEGHHRPFVWRLVMPGLRTRTWVREICAVVVGSCCFCRPCSGRQSFVLSSTLPAHLDSFLAPCKLDC
jgi:hypothetical protein